MDEKDAIETIEGTGGWEASIYQDPDPRDPREDDNLGQMVCFHHRYKLGDKHQFKEEDFAGWESMEAHLWKEGAAVVLPLYLYDHSSVSISTESFNGRAPHAEWDSGQVGFIYVTKETIRKEYNTHAVTRFHVRLAKSVLRGEVKTFNEFLQGDVYGYQVSRSCECSVCGNRHLDRKNVDSCWGFFGLACTKEAAMEALEAAEEGTS